MIHGKGQMNWLDGRVYNGQWDRNQIHGYGEFKYEDGSIYKGNFLKDIKQG